jgi:hypothetical protein
VGAEAGFGGSVMTVVEKKMSAIAADIGSPSQLACYSMEKVDAIKPGHAWHIDRAEPRIDEPLHDSGPDDQGTTVIIANR